MAATSTRNMAFRQPPWSNCTGSSPWCVTLDFYLARHFLSLQPVPQSLQDELVAALTMPGFIQLSVVINYYRMIAGLAIGFEYPLPEGMSDPFH
jgi:hypothetical protein